MSPVPSSPTTTPPTHPLHRTWTVPPHSDVLPESLPSFTPPCISPEEMHSFPCPHGSGFTHFPHLHPSDLPAHDILDIANFLDSPTLRDIWARRLLNDLTILNAHYVINAILRHTIMDPKTTDGLPPILNDAFSRLYSLHPLCYNPDILPDPLAIYRSLTTNSNMYPCFQ